LPWQNKWLQFKEGINLILMKENRKSFLISVK